MRDDPTCQTAATSNLIDVVDELSACRQRVHTMQLAADAMVRLDSRTGNALARTLDDLDEHLSAVRTAVETMANAHDGKPAAQPAPTGTQAGEHDPQPATRAVEDRRDTEALTRMEEPICRLDLLGRLQAYLAEDMLSQVGARLSQEQQELLLFVAYETEKAIKALKAQCFQRDEEARR